MTDLNKVEAVLSLVQRVLKVPKNNYNNFGKFNYRNCEDICEAVKPLQEAHGFVCTLSDEVIEIAGTPFVKSSAKFEVDGQAVVTFGWAAIDLEKKGMDMSQATGAAMSYARKYALGGLFLLDDTKDEDTMNDGRHVDASNAGQPSTSTQQQFQQPREVSPEQKTKFELVKALTEDLMTKETQTSVDDYWQTSVLPVIDSLSEKQQQYLKGVKQKSISAAMRI